MCMMTTLTLFMKKPARFAHDYLPSRSTHAIIMNQPSTFGTAIIRRIALLSLTDVFLLLCLGETSIKNSLY